VRCRVRKRRKRVLVVDVLSDKSSHLDSRVVFCAAAQVSCQITPAGGPRAAKVVGATFASNCLHPIETIQGVVERVWRASLVHDAVHSADRAC
jgi:hypothetical protein